MTAIELAGEANDVIASVSDIVSLPKIDESDVIHQVERGKDRIKNVVDGLYSLDDYSVSQLEKAKQDIDTMMTYLSELESKFQSGELSIENYKVSAVSDMESFRAITESVFGDGGMFGIILNKFKNGEPITALESEALYHFFQNEVLNDQVRKELEEIASFMNENDIDKLTKRLNEKVVISDSALEDEMLLVQAYLFLGTHMPSETTVEYDTRSKLESYLMLLKEYYSYMVEDNEVILIGKIDYKEKHRGISGHHLDSVIKSIEYTVDDHVMSKNEFRDWMFFDPDNYVHPRIQRSAVMYVTGPDAPTKIRESELKKLEKQFANYEANFVAKEVIKKIVSGLAKKADVSEFVDATKIAIGFDKGRRELNEKIEIGKALNTASRLALDVSISEKTPGKELNIKLYPIDSTFAKIERWRELHNINSNIPFPEEAIIAHDWYEIGQKLAEIEDEFGTKMYQYIYDGSTNGETVHKLANGKN